MGSYEELERLKRERIGQLRQLDILQLADHLKHSINHDYPSAMMAIALSHILEWIDKEGRQQ